MSKRSELPEGAAAIGPNVKRLIAHKMSLDAVPAGGGLASAIEFISTPGRMKAGWQAAEKWVTAAIAVLRTAQEPNPWKAASDEEIAGELLRLAEERKR